MRDKMKILRQAIFNQLQGVLSYYNANDDGDIVKVYDEKKFVTNSDRLYLLLSTQQETDISDDSTFDTQSSIDIEIIHLTDFEVTKDGIDDVSDQVLQILFPTPQSELPGAPAGFQFLCPTRRSAISRNFSIDDASSIVAKIITVSCKIVQQI